MKQENECPFVVMASDEEWEAMEWLSRTLNAIINKPDHCSKEKAVLCKEYIRKISAQNARVHQFAHLLIAAGVVEPIAAAVHEEEMSSKEAEQRLAELGFLRHERGKA
jgi:hypothetical protein